MSEKEKNMVWVFQKMEENPPKVLPTQDASLPQDKKVRIFLAKENII